MQYLLLVYMLTVSVDYFPSILNKQVSFYFNFGFSSSGESLVKLSTAGVGRV